MFPNSYYENINQRLRGILILLVDELPSRTCEVVTEFLDANELGIALERIVEVLSEKQVVVDQELIRDLAELAQIMKMEIDVEGLLRGRDDG